MGTAIMRGRRARTEGRHRRRASKRGMAGPRRGGYGGPPPSSGSAHDPARGPVRNTERIVTLDIVRGFALLGILIMNMPNFSISFFAGADGAYLWPDQ